MMKGKKAALAALLICAGMLAGPAGEAGAASAGAFNPWTNAALPNVHAPKGVEAEMLKKLGGVPQSIEAEAGWRRHWREEAYPVFFGRRDAPREVLVLLDFANPASRRVWRAVREAMAKFDPRQVKVVVMADSNELYAYDMMGLAIWANVVGGRGADALAWGLDAWERAKQRTGRSRPFVNEYDSAASPSDLPLVFQGLRAFGVPESMEADVADYVYGAGNVNMHQAGHAMRYYGVRGLPAVVVNGRSIGAAGDGAAIAQAALK